MQLVDDYTADEIERRAEFVRTLESVRAVYPTVETDEQRVSLHQLVQEDAGVEFGFGSAADWVVTNVSPFSVTLKTPDFEQSRVVGVDEFDDDYEAVTATDGTPVWRW